MKAHTKRAIAKVLAGPQIGTAFLISDRLLLSAVHVVADRSSLEGGHASWYSPIFISFEGEDGDGLPASVVEDAWDASADWVVLELQTPRPDLIPIPLGTLTEGLCPTFEAFGYPIEHGKLTISGAVRDSEGEYFGSRAIQLYAHEVAAGVGLPLHGLSGSPCIVEGMAVGVVRAHPLGRFLVGVKNEFATVKNGAVYACPIATIAAKFPNLPKPKVLTPASLEVAARLDQHLESFHSYQRALARLASGTSYELSGLPLRTNAGKPLDLPGTLGNSTHPSAATLVMSALSSGRNVVIEATAGAGKTSHLLLLAQSAWSHPVGERFVALFVRLKDLAASSGATFSDRLSTAISRDPGFAMGGRGVPKDVLTAWPEVLGAPLVLLLDAIDEVAEPNRRGVLEWVASLMAEHRSVTAVVSTRDVSLLRGTPFELLQMGGPVHITLASPSRDQTIEIMQSSADVNAGELVQRSTDAGLSELISTPLGAVLAAVAYAVDGTLPDYRAGIYAKYVRVALDKARAGTEAQELTSSQIELVLEAMAWAITQDPSGSARSLLLVARDAIIEANTAIAPRAAEAEAEMLLERIGLSSGLINRDFVWKHETFREYLAAKWIAAHVELGGFSCIPLLEKFGDARWRGVLLFLFNIWSDPSSRSREVEFQRRKIFQALLPDYKPPGTLHRLISKVIGNRTPTIRIEETEFSLDVFAAEVVIESRTVGSDVASQALVGLLKHQSKIEETFRNWCRLLFTNEGKEERRVLRRWAKQPLLAKHLEPYVSQWLVELTQQADTESYGRIGMLLLCGAEGKIHLLIEQQKISNLSCAGVVEASGRFEESASDLSALSMKAIRLLIDRYAAIDAEMSSVIKENSEALNPAFLTTSLDDINASAFMRRVRQYGHIIRSLEGLQEKDYPRTIVAGLLRLPEHDRRQLSEAIRTSPNPHLVVDVVLRSLSQKDRLEALGSEHLHDALKRHIRRWFDSPKNNSASPNELLAHQVVVTLKQYEVWRKSLFLVKRWASDTQFVAALTSKETPLEVCAELLRNDSEPGWELAHSDLLIAAATDDSVRPSVRELILEALYRREPLPEYRSPLLRLISDRISCDPRSVSACKRRAELREIDGDYLGMEQDLSAVLTNDPGNGAALEARARARYFLDREDEALSDIDLSIASGEELGYRHYLRGLILYSAGRYAETLEALKSSEAHAYSEGQIRRLRAKCRYRMCLLHEALQDTEWLLKEDSGDLVALDVQLAAYTDLGRWQESMARGREFEDALSKQVFWPYTRMQNAFALGSLEDFDAAAKLVEAVDPGPLPQLFRLYLQRRNAKVWSSELLARLCSAEGGRPDNAQLFWIYVASDDEAAAQRIVMDLKALGPSEPAATDARWIVCLAPLFTSETRAWAQPLLALLKPASPAPIPADTAPQKPTAPPPPPRVQRVRRRKILFSKGLLCKLASIESYEEEKDICSELLKGSRDRIGVLIPLLDTGHVYMQTNVLWETGDPFSFKLCGDFDLLLRHGVFDDAIIGRKLKTVVVTDRPLFERLRREARFAKMASCLACIPVTLPYTSADVEWTANSKG